MDDDKVIMKVFCKDKLYGKVMKKIYSNGFCELIIVKQNDE